MFGEHLSCSNGDFWQLELVWAEKKAELSRYQGSSAASMLAALLLLLFVQLVEWDDFMEVARHLSSLLSVDISTIEIEGGKKPKTLFCTVWTLTWQLN